MERVAVTLQVGEVVHDKLWRCSFVYKDTYEIMTVQFIPLFHRKLPQTPTSSGIQFSLAFLSFRQTTDTVSCQCKQPVCSNHSLYGTKMIPQEKKKKKKDKATVNFGPFQKGKVKNISVNRLLRRSSKHIFYSEAGARTACSVSPVSASGPHHP